MKLIFRSLVYSFGIWLPQLAFTQTQTGLIKKNAIELPGVKGSFDLMAYDHQFILAEPQYKAHPAAIQIFEPTS